MKPASLDTSALVRILVGDDSVKAAKVKSLLEQNRNYHVSDLAIVEFSFVAKKEYDLDRSIIAACILFLMKLPNINCNRQLFDRATKMYLERPRLSLVDCCLAVQASLNNAIPLLTFDRKLANQSDGLAKLIT